MEKNKEITTMMEFIEYLKELQQGNSLIIVKAIDVAINKAKSLLPKEKQVNEDFFEQGIERGQHESFETYYNTKYNNQIK